MFPVPTSLPVLVNAREIAVFLDFDGTLVELADRPDAVSLAARTRTALGLLVEATGGAVAIVTGREIATLDGFLAPLHLPAAGVHGLTRRAWDGRMHESACAPGFVGRAESALQPLLAASTGLLLERKSNAVALHYRARPELEAACIAAMERVADAESGIQVKRGKMVVEAKPTGADKGTAITDFMRETPFAGRTPLFAGDDVTDEDAFVIVNALGGITIKVGQDATAARWRAATTGDFLDWLHETAIKLAKAQHDS